VLLFRKDHQLSARLPSRCLQVPSVGNSRSCSATSFGSTALASRLDLEDLREVIGDYHKDVERVVGRFDGFVAKYMGDGGIGLLRLPAGT